MSSRETGDCRISLLLPTRQRPRQLSRLVDSVNATAARPGTIELVTYIDSDDPTYDNLTLDIDWVKIRGPRVHDDGLVNLSAKWDDCYAACHGDVVMHAGDDIVMCTHAWDDIVREAFDEVPDRILFAYGLDGIQPSDFGTHGFLSREWVRAVGFFLPPLFSSDYNDVFLNQVAKMVGRHRLVKILTEHLHYCVGKAPMDRNTQERLERHQHDRPDLLYHSPKVQDMIAAAAAKLRAAMR